MSSLLATLLSHSRTEAWVESPMLLETLSPSIEKNPFLTKKNETTRKQWLSLMCLETKNTARAMIESISA